MPPGLPSSVGAVDIDGRMVLLAVEATHTILHAPVLRLPGVGMYGEPVSDRTAAMEACKISMGRKAVGAVKAATMSKKELKFAGSSAIGT